MTQRHTIKRKTASPTFIPFSTIAEKFLTVQEGRGNFQHTIKHYQNTIKKLQLFLCWFSDESNEYPMLTDAKRLRIGAYSPISLFEREDIESELRHFLFDVEEVSDFTVCTYFRDYRVIAY